ncbi:MAG: helix-turn-helix transcriptional regulator [Rhizobiaceae bacterium]|nr:MAG: helix-turn-helix transcriptional regulator [Rhizobiaceae bacterium]CAG0967331.1 HTH-type quorum sensing-dependent transcriptional regulator VjbR [Rhizobiaceae bacterium]
MAPRAAPRRTKKRPARPGPAERAKSALAEFRTRFAEIAGEAGCEEFAVFLVGSSPSRCRLQPLLDGDHPRTSRLSRRLSGKAIEAGAARLQTSSVPFIWHKGARRGPAAASLAAVDNLLGLDGSGIAFPLPAGAGRIGLAVFAGAAAPLSGEEIITLHLRCIGLFSSLLEKAQSPAGDVPAMSNRELDCLRLTADGKTSEEIAAMLGLSVHTATQYLTSAAQKLDAVSRTHAVAKALRLGLIT